MVPPDGLIPALANLKESFMLMLSAGAPFVFLPVARWVKHRWPVTAIHLTTSGKRVLLVSTDPASNVACLNRPSATV